MKSALKRSSPPSPPRLQLSVLQASSPVRAVENTELEGGSGLAPGSSARKLLFKQSYARPIPPCATAVPVRALAPLWSPSPVLSLSLGPASPLRGSPPRF